MFFRISILFCCLLPALMLRSQVDNSAQEEFDSYYQMALDAMDIYLYEESLSDLQKAIEVSKQNNLEKSLIRATISWGELMRKTGDHRNGIEALNAIPNSSKYPRLHVNKLGRLAALYTEMPDMKNELKQDSIIKYISEALTVAQQNNLALELAGLKNELGYNQQHRGLIDSAMVNFTESVRIYDSLEQDRYQAGVMTNLIRLNVMLQNYDVVDSLKQAIKPLFEGKKWYSTEVDLYYVYAQEAAQKKDSLSFYKWSYIGANSFVALSQASNTEKINSFRAKYENEKLEREVQSTQSEIIRKDREIEYESKRGQELTFVLVVFIVLFLLVIIFLIIANRSKANVNKLNVELESALEKNKMLVKESNHRIKNNLQMVTSLLHYSKKSGDEVNIDKITNKIEAISALHRLLNFEVHNEKVKVKSYISEIVEHFQTASDDNLNVELIASDISVSSERMVYLGLILSEMLSNSMEHRDAPEFPIRIEANSTEDRINIKYQDFSDYGDFEKGTGIELIEKLILRLKGEKLQFDSATGCYIFEFYG